MNLLNNLLARLNIDFDDASFIGEIQFKHRNCVIRKDYDTVNGHATFSLSLIDKSLNDQQLIKINFNDEGDFISGEVSDEVYSSYEDFYADASEYLQLIIDEFDGE